MKPNPWQMAILVAVVIITVFATRKYDEWRNPPEEPVDIMLGTDSTQITTVIEDTVEVEIGNTVSVGGGNPDSLCSWIPFRVSHNRYEVEGEIFGYGVRTLKIFKVTARTTIHGELWKLADGSNRITLRGGEGVKSARETSRGIAKRSTGTTGSSRK